MYLEFLGLPGQARLPGMKWELNNKFSLDQAILSIEDKNACRFNLMQMCDFFTILLLYVFEKNV